MAKAPQHTQRYRRVTRLILRMREDAGLTQRDLAARLKKPQSWVYKCESANRRVDVAEFCEWCKACGVKPSDVVDEIAR